MTVDAESVTGPVWSRPNDPRITRIGRWLRQSHIDEFPQLWNVLRGEMSLVGPRPERPEFVERLAQDIPSYHERMVVRPGITGLAQLRLPADTDLDSVRRKVTHDVFYARHLSPLLDLKLLVVTALRLVMELGSFCRVSLRLPTDDEIQDGFFLAVGLQPCAVTAVPVATHRREPKTM